MKKNNTREESNPRVTKCSRRELQQQAGQEQLTIGLDMGDRMSQYCVLSKQGEKLREDRLGTTRTGLSSLFEKLPRVRVVLVSRPIENSPDRRSKIPHPKQSGG